MSMLDIGKSVDPIERAEFVERRKTLAERIAASGLAGAIAFGRQGTATISRPFSMGLRIVRRIGPHLAMPQWSSRLPATLVS